MKFLYARKEYVAVKIFPNSCQIYIRPLNAIYKAAGDDEDVLPPLERFSPECRMGEILGSLTWAMMCSIHLIQKRSFWCLRWRILFQ